METLARAANRGSVSTGYDIDNSLKLEIDNTEYITRTNASAGNSKTWTFSGWYKLTELFSGDGPSLFEIYGGGPLKFFSIYMYQYTLIFYDYLGGVDYGKQTTQVFRDTSAWYHIVLSVDTTDATAADRMKLYINGTRVTTFSTDFGDPPQNFDTQANKSGMANRIGYSAALSGIYYSGYVSEVNFVDGQALAPTDFGEFDADTGIWKPIETNISSYGTNGFQLKFDNSSDLGEDANGGTSFTLNNITSVDQATDTPTNNFCTLNPLIYYGYGCTISQGAVKASDNSVGLGGAAGTVAVNKGKWYWEFQTNGANTIVGVQDIEADTTASDNAHETPYTMGLYLLGEYNYVNDSGGGRNDGAVDGFVHANANFYGIALNMDDNEIEYYVNGVQKGPTFSLDELSDLYLRPFVSSSSSILYFNFGAIYPDPISTGNADANGYGNFEYAPPSGYYALCSKNLAEFG